MNQQDEVIKPVIPVKQDLVPFERITILSVRLPDNRVAALFSLLCEVLRLDRSGQVKRIRADPAIAHCLIPARIETPGGPQILNVLIAGAIPTWLSGINPGKVAPELRPLLLALKREAADVLYRHFFHIDQTPPPPPEQPAMPPDSPRALLQQGFQLVDKAMRMLESHQQTTDEHLAALEQWREITQERQQAMGEYLVETRERVQALEQRRDEAPSDAGESEPPSGKRLLSPQHLGQVYVLARQERRRSGQAISALLAALAQAFGVPDISDLPDSAWDDVLGWFWERQRRR